MTTDVCGRHWLKVNFRPEESEANLKAGIFIELEITEFIFKTKFTGKLNRVGLTTWYLLLLVVHIFLRNY